MTLIEKGKAVLTRIMDGDEPIVKPTQYLESWSEGTRSKVKQAFSKTKCEARIINHWYFGAVLEIRPKDVQKLQVELANAGLMTDSLCQGLIGALKDDPEHFIGWTAN